jgi:hypothetical protein
MAKKNKTNKIKKPQVTTQDETVNPDPKPPKK